MPEHLSAPPAVPTGQPARYRHPPLQPGQVDAPHHFLALPGFTFESGLGVEDFVLSYAVHGELSPARDNAVLVLSAIASHHHRLDFLIGPGRALDPARWCVIAVDAIGNGLTTSPSTSGCSPGLDFPSFNLRDMVESQRRLLDHLGIERVAAVVGASMGGMQALQWGVSHPGRIARVVAMTPMARTHPWAVAVNEAARRTLLADPDWLSGRSRGLSAWVTLMQLVCGRTPAALSAFGGPQAVADWIEERTRWQEGQGYQPVDWVYQSRAYDSHDVGSTPGAGGSLGSALARIDAATLVLAAPDDLYNPTEAAREAARGIRRVRYAEIPSRWGHQAATANDPAAARFIDREIAGFLAA